MYSTGKFFERLWGFFNPENQTAEGLSKCILKQLDIILKGSKHKLVAQTFDGANVMRGKKSGVQVKIKEEYKNAQFIHCYAHRLNLIMKHVARTTRNGRVFFSNLLAIATFFSRSPNRLSVLNKHLNSSISGLSITSWNFHTCTFSLIYENFESFKNCLEELKCTATSDESINEATGVLYHLNSKNFIFWLNFFYQVMPHVKIIFYQMQSPAIDSFKVQEYIKNFNEAISKLRNSNFFDYCDNPPNTLIIEAKEVCDTIRIDIAERYAFTKHLIAAKLFNKDNFGDYKSEIVIADVKAATEAYPMIEKEQLFNELQVFYSRADLHNYDKLTELLDFIIENNIESVFEEMVKLIKILLTIPMITSEAERCHSTLERIKTFLRTAMNRDRLNALAIISVEKKFISCIPSFNDRVIDAFSQNKNRQMDFIYK